jgi:hypothetical protein
MVEMWDAILQVWLTRFDFCSTRQLLDSSHSPHDRRHIFILFEFARRFAASQQHANFRIQIGPAPRCC